MPAMLEFFDRIYVVNLPERRDRYDEMVTQLNKVGISASDARVCFFAAQRPSEPAGFPSIGARGCFLSHLSIVAEAADHHLSRILILEDDTDFIKGFDARMDAAVRELSLRDWSLFYGSYRLPFEPTADKTSATILVGHDVPIETTSFVAFQGEAVAAMARYLSGILTRPPGDPRGGPMHVDGAYTWFRKDNPQFPTLVAVPELGYQRPSRSDVTLSRLESRVPLLSGVLQYARRMKSAITRMTK